MSVQGLTTAAWVHQNVKNPWAEGYGAKVGELWVRLVPSAERPLVYYTKDSLAQRQDTGQSSGQVLEIGEAWARTEYDGGEGLDWDPREMPADSAVAANDVRRFWSSHNVDVSAPPAGEPYALRLAHRFVPFDATHVTNAVDIAASATHVFVAHGAGVRWYTSWDSLALDGETAIAGGVIQLAASPGDDVMALAADGSVWYRGVAKPDFTKVYDGSTSPHASGVWFVKGRFVVARSGELGEMLPDGTFTTFDTFSTSYKVVSVVSTGPSIIAAVTDGTIRSYVPEQSNQLDPMSVNLVIRGRTDMPNGEIPSVLGSVGSVVTVLTVAVGASGTGQTTRFYRAEALSAQYDYVVGGLQLQREWFDSYEDVDVTSNMSSSRDAIWFAVTESDKKTYMWRFDAVTLGLSRHAEMFDGVGHATTLFDSKLAAVNSKTGTMAVESDVFLDYGYLISPNLTFGLNTDIVWIASVLESVGLGTGEAYAELWMSKSPEGILDHADSSWELVTRLYSDRQSGVETPLVDVKSRTLALQLRLFSPQGRGTPEITRLAVRGLPSHRDWIVNMPIDVSDYYEVPYRQVGHRPGMGDMIQEQLLSMVGSHVNLEVLRPSLQFHGVVNAVEEPVRYITPRGSPSTYVTIQFLGARVESTSYPTGDSGMGMGMLGVTTLGIGQGFETHMRSY